MTRISLQRGSAFFIILIAIAIFAALSFAVMQGSRVSQSQLSGDQARLAAQEIAQHADTIGKAVQTLRLRGCSETEISAETAETTAWLDNPSAPSDNSCHIYDLSGGKVNYSHLNVTWLNNDPTEIWWWYNSEMAVENVGSAEPELILWAADIKPEICNKLNQLLWDEDAKTETTSAHTYGFDGTYVVQPNGIGDDVGSFYIGKSSGCMTDGSGGYDFYQVLIAR